MEALKSVVSQQSNTHEFHPFGQAVAQKLRQVPIETASETE